MTNTTVTHRNQIDHEADKHGWSNNPVPSAPNAVNYRRDGWTVQVTYTPTGRVRNASLLEHSTVQSFVATGMRNKLADVLGWLLIKSDAREEFKPEPQEVNTVTLVLPAIPLPPRLGTHGRSYSAGDTDRRGTPLPNKLTAAELRQLDVLLSTLFLRSDVEQDLGLVHALSVVIDRVRRYGA
jgi:hypothetical protein